MYFYSYNIDGGYIRTYKKGKDVFAVTGDGRYWVFKGEQLSTPVLNDIFITKNMMLYLNYDSAGKLTLFFYYNNKGRALERRRI